jgi:hypothetical protein
MLLESVPLWFRRSPGLASATCTLCISEYEVVDDDGVGRTALALLRAENRLQ